MVRTAVGALLGVLLIVSVGFAQDEASLESQMNAELAAQGLDPATASDAEKESALEAVFQAAIAAELGGDVAGATDDEIAAAVNAIVTRNPSLADNTVGALAAAGAKLRPSAAAVIAGQAATARPSAAGAITYSVSKVAVDAAPGGKARNQAAADVAIAVANAVYAPGDDTAIIGEIGLALSVAASERAGYAGWSISAIYLMGQAIGVPNAFYLATVAAEAKGGDSVALLNTQAYALSLNNLGSQFLDEGTLFIEENPAQDASPT